MALTLTTSRVNYVGDQKVVYGTVTFDSSYATGGEAFDKTQIGLQRLDFINFNQGEDGYIVHWDAANAKLMLFESGTASAALDEQDSAGDMSAVVVEFQAFGG